MAELPPPPPVERVKEPRELCAGPQELLGKGILRAGGQQDDELFSKQSARL